MKSELTECAHCGEDCYGAYCSVRCAAAIGDQARGLAPLGAVTFLVGHIRELEDKVAELTGVVLQLRATGTPYEHLPACSCAACEWFARRGDSQG